MKKNKIQYYETNDVVRILNWKQATYYWATKGITPISIYPSEDFKTGDPIIVFVFSKSETQDAYKDWINARK